MYTEKGFVEIPGLPDGWRLVRIGPVLPGEWRLMNDRSVRQWVYKEPSLGWAVVLRKIGPEYRQFANAEEYRPHRDRWVRHKDDTPDSAFRILEYRDSWVMNISGEPMDFADAFSELLFGDDGTPFGVKIDE